jgi:hypothetical protein
MAMTRAEAEADYNAEMGDNLGSIELAKAALKNQIEWLDWVVERDFTPVERKRILKACRAAYIALRPLTQKYID